MFVASELKIDPRKQRMLFNFAKLLQLEQYSQNQILSETDTAKFIHSNPIKMI